MRLGRAPNGWCSALKWSRPLISAPVRPWTPPTRRHAVSVKGEVTAPWRGDCRRCLRAVEGELTARVEEIFDVHPIEGETYPLEGERVTLEPMVRDAALLALPLAPLCDEACPGPEPGA